MFTKNFCTITLILLSLVTPCILYAEIIFLNNGSVIFGKIISQKKKQIVCKEYDTGKKRVINFEEILRVRYNIKKLHRKHIYRKNKPPLVGYIVAKKSDFILLRKRLHVYEEIKIKEEDIVTISNERIKGKYTFSLNIPASKVAIEGDFSGWNPVNMQRTKDTWKANIDIDIVKRNDYRYRYVIDDEPGKIKYIKFKIQDGIILEDIDQYKPTLGFRIGGGAYYLGYADNIKLEQPTFTLTARSNIPYVFSAVAFQLEGTYARHIPNKTNNPELKNLDVEVTNYITGGYFLYDFTFFDYITISPKIGGGYVFQVTKVSGFTNDTLNNYFPFIGGGIELSYIINRYIYGVMSFTSIAEIENKKTTYLNMVSFGVNLRFNL